MGLKHVGLSLGLPSVVLAAIAVAGPAAMWLVVGLICVVCILIVVLALTGTFGRVGRREAAQTVLAILLNRDHPRAVGSTRRSAAVCSSQTAKRPRALTAPARHGQR